MNSKGSTTQPKSQALLLYNNISITIYLRTTIQVQQDHTVIRKKLYPMEEEIM